MKPITSNKKVSRREFCRESLIATTSATAALGVMHLGGFLPGFNVVGTEAASVGVAKSAANSLQNTTRRITAIESMFNAERFAVFSVPMSRCRNLVSYIKGLHIANGSWYHEFNDIINRLNLAGAGKIIQSAPDFFAKLEPGLQKFVDESDNFDRNGMIFMQNYHAKTLEKLLEFLEKNKVAVYFLQPADAEYSIAIDIAVNSLSLSNDAVQVSERLDKMTSETTEVAFATIDSGRLARHRSLYNKKQAMLEHYPRIDVDLDAIDRQLAGFPDEIKQYLYVERKFKLADV